MTGATETRIERGRGPLWLLHLTAGIIVLACFVYGVRIFESLPDVVATHWGPGGRPDAWSPKTFGSVFFSLLTAAGVVVLLAIIAAAVPKMVLPDKEPSPRELYHREGLIRGTIAALGGTSFLIAIVFAFFALAGWSDPDHVSSWPALLLIALVLGVIPVSYTMASRWARRTALAQGIRPTAAEEEQDKLWVAGILYNNPDDPHILVPKRPGTGIGLTVNVGNRKGRAVMVIFLIVLVIGPLVLGTIASL
ncbi:DUF1648 domain-containing protein [Paenarthrobacter sp. NPDC089989]|uniref:DUF1648 domain-containing protein n=1 Tax=unclassified Paenarthrobacter TaxID=2634190 RepID=UPI003820AA78